MAEVKADSILVPVTIEKTANMPGQQSDLMVKVWAYMPGGDTGYNNLYIGRALLRYWEQCCGAASVHAPQVSRFHVGQHVTDFGTKYTLPKNRDKAVALMTRALARAVWAIAMGRMCRSTIVAVGRENNDNVANLFGHMARLATNDFLVPPNVAYKLGAGGVTFDPEGWRRPTTGKMNGVSVGCMENFGYNRGSARRLSIWSSVAEGFTPHREMPHADIDKFFNVPVDDTVRKMVNDNAYWSYGGGITRPVDDL